MHNSPQVREITCAEDGFPGLGMDDQIWQYDMNDDRLQHEAMHHAQFLFNGLSKFVLRIS